MKTQKELITEHRKLLNEQFHKKYPNGKFTIQRWHGVLGIHWVNERNTSHTKCHGIGVETIPKQSINPYGKVDPTDERVCRLTFQPCSFGKCTIYDSKDKMERSAKRLGVPDYLVEAFNRYFEEFCHCSVVKSS